MVAQIQTFKSSLAFQKENSWGTGIDPVFTMPVNEITPRPTYALVVDRGMRGIGARDYRSQQAGGHGELAFQGFAMPAYVGHLLVAMLGSVSTAGSTVWTHTFKMGNTPPSFTFETEQTQAAAGALRFSGARCSELVFEFDAATGMLQHNSSWMTKIPTKVTGVDPANLALQDMWAGWLGTVTSSGLTSIVTNATFTFSRALSIKHTAQGSQDPYIIVPGPLALEGSLTIIAEDMTDFDVWKAHTTQSFVITFTYGAGDAQRSFKITASSLNLGNGPFEIDRGEEGILYRLPFLAIYNTTDLGPAQVELINNVSSY